MVSLWAKASRLGKSSPKMIETAVITKTTNPKAKGSATEAGMEMDSSLAAKGFAKTAPPIAPDKIAIMVMATLTVESSELGEEASS
jgi:hypothetical protein